MIQSKQFYVTTVVIKYGLHLPAIPETRAPQWGHSYKGFMTMMVGTFLFGKHFFQTYDRLDFNLEFRIGMETLSI